MAADRISCLHDSILYQIFSFLPTKDVVRTTLVSKRWQELWKSVPYLHFDESNFSNSNSFINFVDKILLHRDISNSIIRLQLQCEYAPKGSQIEDWISAAVKARVQELQLYSPSRKAIGRELPSCLYACNSLVTLKLYIGYVARFPDNFCLPNMKIMDVCDVIFPNNFSNQLLKSKSLEELFITHCKIASAPSSCTIEEDLAADDRHHSESFSRLKKAVIGLGNPFGAGNLIGEVDSGLCASKFIRTLSSVEVLCLSNSCIQLLQYLGRDVRDYLPTFCNLNHLDLSLTTTASDVGFMGCLLCCSPVLQSLRIRFFNYHFKSMNLVSKCTKEVNPEEFPPHLKLIKMDHFRGSKNQVELVKLFLANAQVLEEMILHLDANLDSTSQSHKLFEFPRLSTTCQLILISKTSYDNFHI